MATATAGGLDTFIPTLELSGSLMIDFARNLAKYPVNRYCKVTPVKQKRGEYLKFDPLTYARLGATPLTSNEWAPGTLRPTYFDKNLGFEVGTFTCTRKNFGKTLDKQGVDLANWPVLKAHSDALAQEAMTHRAYRVTQKMFDSTQYAASHAVSATTASGSGFLNGGTTADPRIKNAFDYAARLIMKDSNGKVQFGMLSALMNDVTASKLSSTRELREYVQQSPDALAQIRLRGGDSLNAVWGLPNVLYNYNITVESLYYNAYNLGNASAVPAPVVPDNSILIHLADGPQEAAEGAPSYNTCHVFAYEEMTVETNEDTRNRLIYLDIVMDYDVQIVAPVTAVLITNVFS